MTEHQVKNFTLALPSLFNHTTPLKQDRRTKRKPAAAAALGAVLLGPHKAPLVAPPIHAAQHERAGRADDDKRGRLYRRHTRDSPAGGSAILHAQDSASNTAARHRRRDVGL